MKLPTLSNRLAACCSYIRHGDRVADIGCDHGYLGIYLLSKGIAQSVIAADINRGPLDSAYSNAQKYCVKDRMTFHLSDGAKSIPRDFDTMVCAGMGADTIISILEGAPWLKSEQYRLILQSQSRRPELRKYLSKNGWHIISETLAEDGKFIYPIIYAVYQPAPKLTAGQCHISPALLMSNDPLLPDFYRRVIQGLQITVDGLSRTGGKKFDHYKAVLEELLELEELINGNRS